MKRNLLYIINILILILIVFLLIFFYAPKISHKDDDKITVITSIFPNYDFVKQIGQDKVDVKLLLDSGVESHTYEPSPRDMIEIENSDLFVYTGSKFEPWAENILDTYDGNLEFVDTSENIELINADSHIWLSPKNASIMIDNILEKLCKIDSENANFYRKNAENYKTQILRLDQGFKNMISNSKRNEIAFAGEFSYTYFVEEYGLKFVSVYDNCGEEEDPSIAKIKSVIDEINNNNLPIVFYEELSEGAVAKMIGEQTSAKPAVFYTIHNADVNTDTYISLMQKNYEALKEALN